jgi:branched-chain amino acid transport system ATP-binding protein
VRVLEGEAAVQVGHAPVLLQDLQEHHKLAILLIEHDMKFVMHICQCLTVLDHGLTIAQGPPAVIRENRRVIKAYLGEDPNA